MPNRQSFIGGIWTNAAGTLLSRVLGLVRDVVTAALFGLAESGVMDAFVVAVRIPNLFRRILGEGALVASFLPVFIEEHERSAARAWKLFSTMAAWLAVVLLAVIVLCELLLLLAWMAAGDGPALRMLIGFTAAVLPYVLTVCLSALFGAALQAQSKFIAPALAPTLLNVAWIIGAWWIAPWMSNDKQTQAFVLIGCIQVAGVLQVAVQWPALRAIGFRWDYDLRESGAAAWRIASGVAIVSFGLAITQLNTLFDSLFAWFLSVESPGSRSDLVWGIFPRLEPGAAAAIHYGERFYQFPLGVLGIAIATAIFPLLSRHAALGDRRQLGADLTVGIGVTLFVAIPATVGLVLLADPLARVIYQRGEFTAADAARTARMIATYSSAVWAFCLLPVVTRAFFAIGNQRTPVRVGISAMLVNFTLDLILVRWFAETGLAASTAIAAVMQVAVLLALFAAREHSIGWPELGRSLLRTAAASLAMLIAVVAIGWLLPEPSRATIGGITIQILTGLTTYLLTAWSLSAPELKLLLQQRA